MKLLIYFENMVRKGLSVLLMIVFVFSLFFNPTVAYAETEEVKIDNAKEYTIEQKFSRDYYLNGLMTSTNEFFTVEDWEISDAEINMVFSTTPLAKENLSDLTISVNSKRFYSERILETNGGKREMNVKIPNGYIKKGSNLITIETYIRTTDGFPCVDDVTTANWINIFKESAVKIDYSKENNINNISEFYENFLSIHALNQNLSSIIINPSYDESELEAALKVMTGASSNATKFYDNIDFAAQLNESEWSNYEFVIYVAKIEHLPSKLTNQISDHIKGLQEGQGLIEFVEGDANYLILTAKDDKGLDKVARMMMNRLLINQAKGKSIALDANSGVDTREVLEEQIVKVAPTGKYIKGAFRQAEDFYMDMPSNRMLTVGSEVSVNMKYSDNLDFNRSLVTLYINDIPIGSRKLQQGKVDEDNFTVQIPSDLNIAGPFKLTVAYDLEIQDLWCTLRQPETPWAYITNESYMDIKYIDIPYYLFEYYPNPFVSEGMYNNVAVVIPDNNKAIPIQALAKTFNLMGRSIKSNRGELELYRASNVNEKELKGKNTILFGTFNDNPLIKNINEHLFFKFNDKGTSILSNSKMNMGTIPQEGLGTVQLLDSPYSGSRTAMLVVSGVQQEGVINAARYIGDAASSWGIYGDGYVADSKNIFAFRFKKDNEKSSTIVNQFKNRTDVTGFILISTLLIVLILVIVILMTTKYGRKGMYKHGKKK